MKIGLLTFHYGSNYGGVLQAYALQQTLSFLGHDTWIINFRPKDKFKQFLIVTSGCLRKRKFKELFFYLSHFRHCQKIFEHFCNQYLRQTTPAFSEKDLRKLDFDVISVGSDQVWNISQQKYKTYFLGWIKGNQIRRISYAACCGKNIVDSIYKAALVDQLSSFYSLSVRSKESQLFIKSLLSKDVPIVADPTMLYDFSEFCSGKNNGGYILTYVLTGDIKGGNDVAINEIKRKYPSLPVYSILISDRIPRLCDWADKQLVDITPNEWVNLIYNCAFMFTDSFHGSVFAMKFNKPLIAYYNGDISGRRFIDLRAQFDMQNVVTDVEKLKGVLNNDDETKYCYSDRIVAIRKASLDYLTKAMK